MAVTISLLFEFSAVFVFSLQQFESQVGKYGNCWLKGQMCSYTVYFRLPSEAVSRKNKNKIKKESQSVWIDPAALEQSLKRTYLFVSTAKAALVGSAE